MGTRRSYQQPDEKSLNAHATAQLLHRSMGATTGKPAELSESNRFFVPVEYLNSAKLRHIPNHFKMVEKAEDEAQPVADPGSDEEQMSKSTSAKRARSKDFYVKRSPIRVKHHKDR